MSTTDFSHGLVNYTSRDYDSLVEEFWNLVPTLTENWKPEADSDPGVVLGKFLSATADMLGVNTDWCVSQLLAPSVTQRKFAEKIFSLCGYELGWYTAARTEVTFTNTTASSLTIDFGFNGSNFSTLNAYTDITNQSRVITYNILPLTNAMGTEDTRSQRSILTEAIDVFAESDLVRLNPGQSVTRVAIEGELRYVSYSVEDIKKNNYIIRLPSQHVDTTAVWIKARTAQQYSDGTLVPTQWVQVSSPADFITPEPRFAVTYDSYSNAQVQISNYLNQLENYNNNWLTIYWIDCSGVIGCVGENVLTNLLLAKGNQDVSTESGDISISNLSNTVELPHTNTVTGKSPETAKEAYFNSRNYINTFDSLVTLPDYTRFLQREPGVDCGVVLDCQKALEINLAIYNDENLTESQKSKMYITNYDFPEGEPIFDWGAVLGLGFDPTNPQRYVFAANFQRYTAMCFAVANNFEASRYGQNQISNAQIQNSIKFKRYKPPILFIDNVIRDFRPLQAMSVEIEFGYLRLFEFYAVGTITPYRPVSQDVANTLIAKAKEALAIYFHPSNRQMGVKPTMMEIVDVIENCDDWIRHFDPGSANTGPIVWNNCDIEYFNYISFARYVDYTGSYQNIRVHPSYIVK